MFVSECLNVNESGHLTVGGADTVTLARQFGTPLYVMDERTIRENCRRFKRSMDYHYGGNGLPLYAGKAFCCREICRIMAEEGMGLDVASGGELYTAIQADFPAERIFFHGNNKTVPELELALEYGVGRIVADNLPELHLLNRIAQKQGKTAHIQLRVKPGVEAHTHSYVQTGQIDSKFGFALETGEAFDAIAQMSALRALRFEGLHCHIGSQIFELEPFQLAAEVMLGFIAKIREELSLPVPELNLGGGFGIRYTAEDKPRAYEDFMREVAQTISDVCGQKNIPVPKIFIEPGRSIVGPAGVTLYTVGSVKTIPGVRTYVTVDGSMSDNPRYALYKASYDCVIANKADRPRDQKVTVAGRCCESGDLIRENVIIQQAEPGDIMAVCATGAYNYSMSMNYNRLPRPAVVMIREGAPRVIVKGETYEDLIRNDI